MTPSLAASRFRLPSRLEQGSLRAANGQILIRALVKAMQSQSLTTVTVTSDGSHDRLRVG